MKIKPKKLDNRLIDLHRALKENPLPPPKKAVRRRSTLNLINASHVKKRLLEYSKSNRAGKYTRVSKPTLEALNRGVDQLCLKVVTDARGGKTL